MRDITIRYDFSEAGFSPAFLALQGDVAA